MKHLLTLTFSTCLAFNAPAAVIGTSHILVNAGTNLEIEQDAAASDHTCAVFFHVTGETFEYGGTCLDEGVSLFAATSFDPFSEENIQKGLFTEYVAGSHYSFSSPVYIAFRTPSLDGGLPGVPAYGWAQIGSSNGSGTLSVHNHAMAYEGTGIIVATQTAIIPEPSSTALLGLFGLSLAARRRR